MGLHTESKTKINVLTGSKLISSESLAKTIYKNLPIQKKLNRKINERYISKNIERKNLLYHPFWIAKLLTTEARDPFPAKIKAYMAFVDAVSGYRGILSQVPHVKELSIDHKDIVDPKIVTTNHALKYVKNVQEKQINSMYLLKKPKHKLKDISLCYMPIWKVTLNSSLLPKTFIINANTGELEGYLQKVWEKDDELEF